MSHPTPAMRLDEVVRQRARTTAVTAALIYARAPFAGVVVTWGELDRWADAFARTLHRAGVQPGNRVALILRDDPACIAAIYGTLRAGAVLIPIDPKWGGPAIARILGHADIHALVGASRGETFEQLGFDRAYEPGFVAFCDQPTGAVEPVIAPGSADDLAMIAFTSGTTSGPKGVMIRHAHLQAAYASCVASLDLSGVRRFGCTLRLSGLGVLGTGYLLAHFCAATAVVLPELTLETARDFWSICERYHIDFIYLVPALVQVMNKLTEPLPPGGHVPLVMVGAAPITAETHEAFQVRFGARMFNCYGLTEASFAVFFGQRRADGFGTPSIGPARGVEARLLDADGRTITAPAATGLLQFRGPMLSDGYWRHPEATREMFPDGWLHTGDIAERDADGNYFIRGRQKDVVIRGGFNIHLQEVDEALLSHPAVLGACAVGAPDKYSGEEVYALVKLKEDGALREAELLAWCKQRLGDGRSPRRIVYSTADIPRNGAGKVARRDALATIADHLHLALS
ncbi:MAG TPA: class I adenylate-forming enzyme family protein [Kofleriaceae bacterium]|nr:class I adenylate-forming enzyme family protein [Kofleriaceae bacterium]